MLRRFPVRLLRTVSTPSFKETVSESRTGRQTTAASSTPATAATSSSPASPSTSSPFTPSPLSYPQQPPEQMPPVLKKTNFTPPPAAVDLPTYEAASVTPFPKEISAILQAPLSHLDVEIKPDGAVYLPEIKYRRILNAAFGPGGWAMRPVGRAGVVDERRVLTRPYQLLALGQFVSEAVGEQQCHAHQSLATAEEGAKSNALMRCCKDLGIASELWDPTFIRDWRALHAVAVWCAQAKTGEKRRLWRKRDAPPFEYPWKEQE